MPEVIPALDIPKLQLEMTSSDLERMEYLGSHYDDHPSIKDYGYGKPTTYDADKWKH
jgi:hypothetical protein